MKKSMSFAGLFSFVVALALAAPAVAQQSPYTIHVPFRFHVDARVLPAGEYCIGVFASGTVLVRGVHPTVSAMFIVPQVNRPLDGPQHASLVFHRYGRQYFLSQVWFFNTAAGYQLGISNTEREVAQQIPTTNTVLLAAK